MLILILSNQMISGNGGDCSFYTSELNNSIIRINEFLEIDKNGKKWKCRTSNGQIRWIAIKNLKLDNMLMKPITSQTVITPDDLVKADNTIPKNLRKCVSLRDFGDKAKPGKGLGLVAEKEYNVGDIIFIETPVIEIKNCDSMELMTALGREMTRLSKPLKQLVLKLHCGIPFFADKEFPETLTTILPDVDIIERTISIFNTNGFCTLDPSGEMCKSLYLLISRVNHSCDPCATRVNVVLPNQYPAGCLVAIKKIPKGDEITINYIAEFELQWPYVDRQIRLKRFIGDEFWCLCKRCIQPDGCGLIVDNTRVLKCRACDNGQRLGLVAGSLFGPCSNVNCNRKIKIKNLVNRADLNGVIATLGARCKDQSNKNGAQSSETERYEVTIKLSNSSKDQDTKTPLSRTTITGNDLIRNHYKNIIEKYKLMSIKRSCFEFIDVAGSSDGIPENLMYTDNFSLKSDDLVIKDDTLYKLEKKAVDEYTDFLEQHVSKLEPNTNTYQYERNLKGQKKLTLIEQFFESASQKLCKNHWVIEGWNEELFWYVDHTKEYKLAIEYGEKNIDVWNNHVHRLCQQRANRHEDIGDLFRHNGEFAKAVKHYQLALRELSLLFSTGYHCVTTVEEKLQKAVQGDK